MSVSISVVDRSLIARLSGEIDHHTSEEIRNRIDKEYSRANARNIIFDFENVTFMDSSGIGMIIGRYKLLENAGGKAAAVKINQSLNRIFDISGLKKIINVYDSVDSALKEI